jgi:FKBP-type peptidyl-prolyl cis-trans isomerase FklB
LAYGSQSPSPKIPANSALVFEVELLDVKQEG